MIVIRSKDMTLLITFLDIQLCFNENISIAVVISFDAKFLDWVWISQKEWQKQTKVMKKKKKLVNMWCVLSVNKTIPVQRQKKMTFNNIVAVVNSLSVFFSWRWLHYYYCCGGRKWIFNNTYHELFWLNWLSILLGHSMFDRRSKYSMDCPR